MEYGAFAIAVLGLISGMLFKLSAFLPIVGILLVAAIAFSAMSEMAIGQAALIVFGSQIVLQVCYFIGVAIRIFISNSKHRPHVF